MTHDSEVYLIVFAGAGPSLTVPLESGWCGSEVAEVLPVHLTCRAGLVCLMHGEGRDDNAARRNKAAAREEAAIEDNCEKQGRVGESLQVAGINSSIMT